MIVVKKFMWIISAVIQDYFFFYFFFQGKLVFCRVCPHRHSEISEKKSSKWPQIASP